MTHLHPAIWLCLCLPLLAALVPNAAQAQLISQSAVTNCDVSATANSTTLSCNKKIVVAITMAAAQDAITSVDAISSVVAGDGTILKVTPIRVVVSKSETLIMHPVRYLQSVNNKPTESIFLKSNVLGVYDSCKAEEGNTDSTCGVYMDANSKPIRDSQGFCCTCSFNEVVGIDSPYSRGSTSCTLFSSSSQSAHCMRFDQLWYNVVALDPPQMAVKFTFTIFTGSENKTITVSPSQRTAKNSDGSVIVRLIGSFQSFVADYDLTTNYLLIPQPATSPTSPQVALGRSDWMLVPKSTVDLTGATCDKIGVGFTPFRYQEGQCTRPSGSCLNNQPKDFWTADTTLRRQGKMVNYFLERYGDILGLYAGASDIVSMSPGQQYVLATRPRDPASILFTMEIAADSLTFYNNLGQASIKVFSVTDFESLSQRGTLRVLVASETPLEALYAVRVVDCVPAIFPIAEQSQSIGSYQAKWYTFTLQTMTPIGGNTNCTILLVNSNSDQLDKKFVSFRTNSTTIYKGNQGGSEPGDDDDRGNDPSSGLSLNFLGDAAKWLADAIASGYGVVLIMGLSAIVLAILRGCARCCCKLGVSEKHKDRSACVNFFHDLLQICLLPIYLIKYIIDIFRKPPPPDQDDMNTRRFDERSAPRASFDEEGRWSQRLSTSPQDSPSSHSTTGLMGPSRGPMTESASRRRLQFDSARNSDASATSSTSRSAMIGHTVLATSRKVGRTLWNAVRAGSSMLRARLARDAAVGSEASQAPTWTEMEQTRRAPLEPTGASDVSRPRQTMPEHATANQNRAVSSHRPRTTLSRAELQILARSNRPVYFNFRRVRLQEIGSQIFNPGPQFSVLGRMSVLTYPDSPDEYIFHLDSHTFQTMACNEQQQMEELHPARRLDEAFFTQGLTLQQAERLLSTHPQFPCINPPGDSE